MQSLTLMVLNGNSGPCVEEGSDTSRMVGLQGLALKDNRVRVRVKVRLWTEAVSTALAFGETTSKSSPEDGVMT